MRTASLAIALLLPAQAHALSCGWGPIDALPADTATDVPLNVTPTTVILDGSGSDFTASLLRDGVIVEAEVTRESQGASTMLRLEPAQDLRADTTYTVRIAGPSESAWESTFTTGEALDTTAPTAPTVVRVGRNRRSGGGWGRIDQVELELEPVSDDLVYRISVADPSTGALIGRSYKTGWVDSEDGVRRIATGEAPCSPDMELPRSVDVSVEAIDIAGNVSPSSEAGTAGGCSASTAPAAFGLAFLGWGLVGLRRRR